MKIARLCMVLLCASLLAASAGAAPAPEATVARADSLAGYWGTHPARADSNTALPQRESTPIWQTTLLVPYYIVGIPLTLTQVVAADLQPNTYISPDLDDLSL